MDCDGPGNGAVLRVGERRRGGGLEPWGKKEVGRKKEKKKNLHKGEKSG
jgi:hypothetical protein